MSLEVIVTKDGSHSIYNSDLNETYHSVGGAIHESQFIYIDQGLKPIINPSNELAIFEVGFGTGLNAILTLREAIDNKCKITYKTLEPYPLPESIIKQLNYPSLFDNKTLLDMFYLLHNCPWEVQNNIDFFFNFHKVEQKIEDFNCSQKYDLVYYDAFAPSKQIEIWDISNLIKVKELLKIGGVLITYCSSGKFKRDLREAGFLIESLPGPMGKREITRAYI